MHASYFGSLQVKYAGSVDRSREESNFVQLRSQGEPRGENATT